jgi:hypothetical protein
VEGDGAHDLDQRGSHEGEGIHDVPLGAILVLILVARRLAIM